MDAMNQQTDQPAPRPDFLHSSAEAIPGRVALSQAIDYSSGTPASLDSQAALPRLGPIAHEAIQQEAPSIASAQPDLAGFSAHALTAPMNPAWSAISSSAGHHSEGLNNTASGDLNLNAFDGRHGGNDFQETSPNFQTPTWQTSADFELNAFHRSILDTSFGWPLDDLSRPQLEQFDLPSNSPQNLSSHREDSVQQHWFTSLPPHRPDDVIQDAGGERNKVDEAYRASLSQRLLLRVPHEPLPSADFLVHPPKPLVHPAERLTAIEPLHSNVLYPLQPHLPSHPRTDVSTVIQKLAITPVNMLYWELVPWLSLCCSTGPKDLRAAQ